MAQSVQGEAPQGSIDFYRKVREFKHTYKGLVNAVLEGRLSANTAKEQMSRHYTQLLHHPSASDCLENDSLLGEYLDVVAEEFKCSDKYRHRQQEQFKAECEDARLLNESIRQHDRRRARAALCTAAAGAGMIALNEAVKYVGVSNLEQALEHTANYVSENAPELTLSGAVGVFAAAAYDAIQESKSFDWARTRVMAGMIAVSALLSTMHSSSGTHYAKPHKAAEIAQEGPQYGLTLTDMIRLPWVNR